MPISIRTLTQGDNDMTEPLFEKHRPRTYADVVGQDRAVKAIATLRPRGLGGRGYYLSGPSGFGKSSLAYLLAAEIAPDIGTTEVDATQLTPKDVEEWRLSCRSKTFEAPGGRVLLINECHGLRKDTVKMLLNLLDGQTRLPGYAAVIMTTTCEGQLQLFEGNVDAHPLMSRCVVLPMATKVEDVALPFAIRLRSIAQSEHLDGRSLVEYLAQVRRNKGNQRMCLNEIESGAMLVS